jgi:hypothetical protein
MDNPEKLATRRCNQEWTIQRNWQHEGTIKNEQSRETGNTKGQSRMNNPEKLATLGTQDTRGRQTKQINTTQYMLETSTHKTQNEDKQNKNTTQYVLDTTIHKQT